MNQTTTGVNEMAMFDDIISRSKIYFPSLEVKYKDKSILMKILGKILFFNPRFMQYTTTFGSTIYLPSEAKVRKSPVSNSIIFMHELSHFFSISSGNKFLHGIMYLFPQILALLAVPAFFFFGFKIALICLLFLLPLPAYFRMNEEKQAYTISLYVMNKLNGLNNFKIDLEAQKERFIGEFSSGSYYYMWTLPGIRKSFDEALEDIKSNGKPTYDIKLYEMIDNIIEG